MRLKGFQKLTPVDEALKAFFQNVHVERPKAVLTPLHSALNRVLAEDIIAEEDLPRFDRSAVDGYAVKAKYTVEASQFKARTFQIIDNKEITGKQAKRVWTGNPIPKGADAVLMLENTRQIDSVIEIWIPLTPGENVSKRGEDIQKGDIAGKARTRLKPQHLGLIAALGIGEVKVFEKPKIAILATGNELVEVGVKSREDQVFEVNSLILSALCHELDAEPLNLGVARDNIDEIVERIRFGLARADVMISTGGTSVGISDLVPEAVNKIGKPGIIIHGVAMRPAMPTALGVIKGKPIVVLSGNPVAAVFGFEVFARPLICKMLGLEREERRLFVMARMTKRVVTALGRRTFVRVRVFQRNDELLADPISTRGSGIISTMTKSNGYVIVSENREGLEEQELVSVHLFDDIKEE